MNPRSLPLARMLPGACAGVLLGALLLVPARSAAASAETELEYKVKAAFLFNFARFVTWPVAKFESPTSPLEMCVLGDGDFTDILAASVQGKTVGDRPLVVRRADRPESLRRCHIVYVPEADPQQLPSQLSALTGSSVLTVHESEDTQTAGIVRFLIEQRKVRFEINTAAAEREDLHLSSKLLTVARVTTK